MQIVFWVTTCGDDGDGDGADGADGADGDGDGDGADEVVHFTQNECMNVFRSQADATKSNEEAADPETSTAVKESEEKT